jgi:hypothetical protein
MTVEPGLAFANAAKALRGGVAPKGEQFLGAGVLASLSLRAEVVRLRHLLQMSTGNGSLDGGEQRMKELLARQIGLSDAAGKLLEQALSHLKPGLMPAGDLTNLCAGIEWCLAELGVGDSLAEITVGHGEAEPHADSP